MFTGIIEEIGKVQTVTKNKLVIEAINVLENTKIGDSIAVNGICLTVTKIDKNKFEADISDETKSSTNISFLRHGTYVNLERAMGAYERFGGHIVSGHIDGIGKISSIKEFGNFYNFEIELSSKEAQYIIKKGSVTVNGISLTVAEIYNNIIKIAIVPHTFKNTTLQFLKVGEHVNIEVDVISKYVEKFLSMRDNRAGIDMEFLRENGF